MPLPPPPKCAPADPITAGENGGCLPSCISNYSYTLSLLQLSVSVASSSCSVGLSTVPVGGHIQNLPTSELFCGELLCPRANPLFQEQPDADHMSRDSALSASSSGSSINNAVCPELEARAGVWQPINKEIMNSTKYGITLEVGELWALNFVQ